MKRMVTESTQHACNNVHCVEGFHIKQYLCGWNLKTDLKGFSTGNEIAYIHGCSMMFLGNAFDIITVSLTHGKEEA